jgi:hypothetical protein
MKTTLKGVALVATLAGLSVFAVTADAAVSADEAAQLKSKLTPIGAERAGNKAGTIPAWDGQEIKSLPGPVNAKRGEVYSSEKPLYAINAQNFMQHADKLSEGQQAMFRKYPEYRIDVYPSHRPAVAPQWVYDNIFKNATRAQTINNGYGFDGAYGGIPFPIPKSGAEAMWNHQLVWQGETIRKRFNTWITTADGRKVMVADSVSDAQFPYYYKEGSLENFKNETFLFRIVNNGPPQKAGEAILLRDPTDMVGVGRQTWQYLTGQRRVRKLPNAAYDTPSFVTSGVSNFDEIFLWSGPMDRYQWKLNGKKEMIVPYNTNKMLKAEKDTEVMAERFLNPDHVRWELHRVWEVEANLVPGKRHVMPKRKFYLDEDTWLALLEDGWDAKGQLWKTMLYLPIVAPDLPGVVPGSFAAYNVLTGEWIATDMMNQKPEHIAYPKRHSENYFTPDALAGEGVR